MYLRKKATLVASLLLFTTSCVSVSNAKPIDLEAIESWEDFQLVAVSKDAGWLATEQGPSPTLANRLFVDKEGVFEDYPALSEKKDKLYKLHLKNRASNTSYELTSGSAFEQPHFSADQKWFAAIREVQDETAEIEDDNDLEEGVVIGGDMAGVSSVDAGAGEVAEPEKELVLINLATGEEETFGKVSKFFFGDDHLFMVKKDKVSLLIAHELDNDFTRHLGPVTDIKANTTGSHIAWTVSADDGLGNGVFFTRTDKIDVQLVDTGEYNYHSLRWEYRGDAFVALRAALSDDTAGGIMGQVFSFERPMNAKKAMKRRTYQELPDGVVLTGESLEDGDDELEPLNSVIAVSDLDKENWTYIEVSEFALGYPEGFNLEANQESSFGTLETIPSVYWNDERTAVLLNFTERRSKEEAASAQAANLPAIAGPMSFGGGGESEKKVPNLAMWHWKNAELPSQLGQSHDQEFADAHPAIYWVATGEIVTVKKSSDPTSFQVPTFMPENVSETKSHIIAYDTGDELKRIRSSQIENRGPQDVYLVDGKSGERSSILKGIHGTEGRLSPDGRYFVYFDKGNFHLYDIEARKSTDLTGELPTSFVWDYDGNLAGDRRRPPIWMKSGGLVLVDNWDIWYLPSPENADSIKMTRITPNGAENRIRYVVAHTDQVYSFADIKTSSFSIASEPLLEDKFLVYAFEQDTIKSSFGMVDARTSQYESLTPFERKRMSGEHQYASIQYLETENGRLYFYKKNDIDEMQLIMSGADFETKTVLFSDNWTATDYRKQYSISSGTELIQYECTWGPKMQGSIVLPANYKKGRKYPAIVQMYEAGPAGTAQQVLDYQSPDVFWNNPVDLASNGYAVIFADVGFQPGRPGQSGFECLMPAVDAAIETGIIDPDKIGIHGHSWGGYQTFFATTQTDRFAAAVAGAGLTDLVSMYGGVFWDAMVAQHSIIERGQGRMIKSIWEDWQSYLDNSPLYYAQKMNTPILFMQNDKDGAVPFYQGVQYFTALRKLSKPAVMLQYRGEGHGLFEHMNLVDYRKRNLEFWAHHLKDEEAPEWWSKGVKPHEMDEHLEERFGD